MPERITERARQAIRERVFPGCVVGILTKDGERSVFPFGNFTYEPGSEQVAEGTIYDVASVTKSIPTASLILLFVEERKLRLSDKVTVYLPELKNDHDATIEDLLHYRVHGTQLSSLRYKTFEEIRTHVFEHGFEGPPGKSVYTNLPAFLLGLIIERIASERLDALAQKTFFNPLKMSHTTFFPQKTGECVPTETDETGEVRGIVHDESARVFAREGRAVGHAGVFSTAPDLLNFLEALLAGRYSYIVEGAQKGLGWQLSQEYFMGKRRGKRTFGKTGFTGCSIVCDMERGTAFVILSNRTYPKCPPNDDAINTFRRDIADIVFENIGE